MDENQGDLEIAKFTSQIIYNGEKASSENESSTVKEIKSLNI